MTISEDEIFTLLKAQQDQIIAVTKTAEEMKNIASETRQEVKDIKLLPQKIEETSENVIGNRFNTYIEGLPTRSFKNLAEKMENLYDDLLLQNSLLQNKIVAQQKNIEKLNGQIDSFKKSFKIALIPVFCAVLLLLITSIVNSVIVRNAVDTANSTIASANSTIQQLNQTMQSAIPKIAEVSTTTGMPAWGSGLIIVAVILFIVGLARGWFKL